MNKNKPKRLGNLETKPIGLQDAINNINRVQLRLNNAPRHVATSDSLSSSDSGGTLTCSLNDDSEVFENSFIARPSSSNINCSSSSSAKFNLDDLSAEIEQFQTKLKITNQKKKQTVAEGQEWRHKKESRIADIEKEICNNKDLIKKISTQVDKIHMDKKEVVKCNVFYGPLFKHLKIDVGQQTATCGEGHPCIPAENTLNAEVCDVFNCPAVQAQQGQGSSRHFLKTVEKKTG